MAQAVTDFILFMRYGYDGLAHIAIAQTRRINASGILDICHWWSFRLFRHHHNLLCSTHVSRGVDFPKYQEACEKEKLHAQDGSKLPRRGGTRLQI